MAVDMDGSCETNGQTNKHTLSWFEFLFDESGELLKDHMKDPSAVPSASQLIIQFLEHSGISSATTPGPETTVLPVDNKRGKRLRELALQVGFHLKWSLEAFEESLPLNWQNRVFDELLKLQMPMYNNVKTGAVSISDVHVDKKSAMTLIIYSRWVIRTLAQHFLPNLRKPKEGMLEAAENESILKNLQGQLSTCICILEDALTLNEDLELPCPIQHHVKSDIPAVQIEPQAALSSNESQNECSVVAAADESISSDQKKIVNNGMTVLEKVNKDEIIAQVSFDLGTLYFYQEKFEKAAKLFQHCKEAKCCRTACYSVNEDLLHGYYMSCRGLLDAPIKSTHVIAGYEGKGHDMPLLEQVQLCKSSAYKDLIPVLIQDNIRQELPMDVRKSLETDTRSQSDQGDVQPDTDQAVSLHWQVAGCNSIRLALEGYPIDSDFWDCLKKSPDHLRCALSFCTQTLQCAQDSCKEYGHASSVCHSLMTLVHLMCNCVNDGFEIEYTSDATMFLKSMENPVEMEEPRTFDMALEPALKWSMGDVYSDSHKDDLNLQCGSLLEKLRTCFDAHQIRNIVLELHRLLPSKRFHTENFSFLPYKTYLDDIQDIILQDVLHIIFSKASHCSSIKDYGLAASMLSDAVGWLNGRVGTSTKAAIEKVKALLNQRLLETDLKRTDKDRKEELLSKVKSYFWNTKQLDSLSEVDKLTTAHLLNNNELSFLSSLKMGIDEESTSFKKIGSLLAAASLSIAKPQEWRKSIRSLWEEVIKIFSSTVQQKRPLEGSRPAIRRDATNLNLLNFMTFVEQIKEETCLTVLNSCLVRLYNLSKEGQDNAKEISSPYIHLWPTSITNRSSVNFEHIEVAMLLETQHALKVFPDNVFLKKTLGDIHLDSSNFSSALKCYLEAGTGSSSLFLLPVPVTVWDAQVFKKMIICCFELKAYIQAALLCQCSEPKDFTTAFKAIQLAVLASEDAMDQYYVFFWDVTMLEYLINTHFKRGQQDKKHLAIQTISQAELNIFNNQDILQHAELTRKASLFRALAKQYL